MRRLLALVLLALSTPSTALSPPPYCAVQASAVPTRTPGIYTVTLEVKPGCPVGGYAEVRLESYIGGQFPRVGWFKISRGRPLERSGVPWYWRGRVRSQTGKDSFPLLIPGMKSPLPPRPPL